jgi:hypothetical protein
MLDFKRRTIISLHNFVPRDDESISPSCFFMLSKMGKPNQASWVVPSCVLGKCIQRYNPGKFKHIDSALKFTINKIILSKRMLFSDKHNWCDKCTDNFSSYNELALMIDLICGKFHERLWAKILEEGGQLPRHHSWKTCMGCMQGALP